MLMFLSALADSNYPSGTGTKNRLIEYTQAGIAAAFTTVTCFLIVMGRAIPAEFWTLNVGIVSFYFTKRSDFGANTNGTKV